MRFSTILMLCLLVLAAFVSADHVDEAKQRASNALNEGREAGKQAYEGAKDKVNEAGERIRNHMHSAFDNGPPHCSDNDGFPSELCEEAEVDIDQSEDGQTQGWVDSAKEKIRNAANYVMGNPDEDGLKTAKEKSKQKFEDLSESAREGFQNMESKAKDKLDNMKQRGQEAKEEVDQKVKDGANAAAETSESLKDRIVGAAKSAGQSIAGMFGSASEQAEEKKEELESRMRRDVGDKVESAKHKIAGKAHDLKDGVEQAAGDIKDSVSRMRRDVGDKVESAKESAKATAHDIKDKVEQKVDRVRRGAEETGQEIGRKVDNAAQNAQQAAQNAKEAVKEGAQAVSEKAGEIKDRIVETHPDDTVSGGLSKVGEGLLEVASSAKDGVVNAGAAVKDTVVGGAVAAKDTVVSGAQAVGEGVSNAGKAVKDKAEDVKDSFGKTVEQAGKDIQS